MLAATPIDGSHYLVDVLAGIVIAVPCLFAARALGDATDPTHAAAANGALNPVPVAGMAVSSQ